MLNLLVKISGDLCKQKNKLYCLCMKNQRQKKIQGKTPQISTLIYTISMS